MSDEAKVAEAIKERSEGFGNPESTETAKDEVKETKESSTLETEESVEETKETSDESGEETKETKESTSEESTEDESKEETEEETEDEESENKQKEFGKKTGVQKRIDRLVAEKHQLEERLKALEGKEKEAKGEKYYTDAELDKAEKKAIDDNDMALLSEVYKERLRNSKHELRTAYEQDKAKQYQEINAKKQEWVSIVDRYSNDDDPSLDIRNQASDLYKLAKAYFEDPELSKEYAGVGGMSKAVADALVEIVRLRGKKKKPDVKKEPERKLAKEKMKTSLGAGSGEKTVIKKELKPSANPVDDYIKEREAEKRKRLG